jgi:hypothetical protein
MISGIITADVLIQRLNRKLTTDNQVLRTTRGELLRRELGEYHTIDLRTGNIANYGLTLRKLVEMGREKKVLADWEAVSDTEAVTAEPEGDHGYAANVDGAETLNMSRAPEAFQEKA